MHTPPSNSRTSEKADSITASPLFRWLVSPIFFIVISGIIGYMLLVLVYCLPTETMKAHMLSGAGIYLTEGQEYEYAEGYKSSILDNETDGVMLSETVYASGNAFEDAALVPRISYTNSNGSVYSLLGILQEDSSESYITTYPNYWHGYLILLKPFYLLFGFADMRIFNLTGVMCVMFFLVGILYRTKHHQFLLPLLVMLIYWNPATISMCIQLADCYYISMLASCFILYYCGLRNCNMAEATVIQEGGDKLKISKLSSDDVANFDEKLILVFLMVGILTVYFDFLTYPIVTLCVPLTFCLICTQKSSVLHSIKRVILSSIYWAVGYVGMWLMKWVISSIVTGQNMFLGAIDKIAERSGTSVDGADISRLKAVMTIVMTYLKWPYLLITVLFIAFLLYLYIRHQQTPINDADKETLFFRKNWIAFIPFVVVALIPLAWLFVTANHCYIHPRLTYRDFGASVFSILAGLMIVIQGRNHRSS